MCDLLIKSVSNKFVDHDVTAVQLHMLKFHVWPLQDIWQFLSSSSTPSPIPNDTYFTLLDFLWPRGYTSATMIVSTPDLTSVGPTLIDTIIVHPPLHLVLYKLHIERAAELVACVVYNLEFSLSV